MWDVKMNDKNLINVVSYSTKTNSGISPHSEATPRSFYNESDAVEEAILFPEDPSEDSYDNSGIVRQIADPKDTFGREFHKMLKGQYARGTSDGTSPSSVTLKKDNSKSTKYQALLTFSESIASTPFLYSYAKDLINKTKLTPEISAQLKKIGVLSSGKKQKPDLNWWMITLEQRCNVFGELLPFLCVVLAS